MPPLERHIAHLLVAVDGRTSPERSVESVLALVAGEPDAMLTFCHVLNVPRMVARTEQCLEDYGLAFRLAREAARGLLERCCVLAGQRGTPSQKCVRYGNPAAEIALLAELIRADVIVIGNEPGATLARFFHGSTRDQLLRETAIPVLVAAAPGKARRGLVKRHVFEDQADRTDNERRDHEVDQHR
jgi:nucleotide-binding universal stress UspA family protein